MKRKQKRKRTKIRHTVIRKGDTIVLERMMSVSNGYWVYDLKPRGWVRLDNDGYVML